MQKIRTALEACRAKLATVPRIASFEEEPGEVTVNLEMGCQRELVLIHEALVELDQLCGINPSETVEMKCQSPNAFTRT